MSENTKYNKKIKWLKTNIYFTVQVYSNHSGILCNESTKRNYWQAYLTRL